MPAENPFLAAPIIPLLHSSPRNRRCPGKSVLSPGVLPWLAMVPAGLLLSGCGLQHISLPTSPPRERAAQPAALKLLHDAEQALHAGDARKADEYLERAIRIESQNPLLLVQEQRVSKLQWRKRSK